MLCSVGTGGYLGGGIYYPVQSNSGAWYVFFVDAFSDLVYMKSTDKGTTWAVPVTVFTGTVTQVAVWFDRWSNISAGLIHLAYTETGGSDILYRSLDTENSDTLGTQTTIFAGASAVGSNGALSITRARGGNLYCGGMIDAGAEGVFARSTDVGANWSARTDTLNEAAADDQFILLPGWAADNQDIMAYFWDASADEISRKLYDDSGDSWAEDSIATSMTDIARSVTGPHFAAAVDITNSRNLLAAWSAVDAANADLRCWTVTESAITEKTNVVLNSTDDQGLCGIGIDTDTQYWYVIYAGISTGGQTWSSSLHLYYKVSTDAGTTWGSETQFSQMLTGRVSLAMIPRFTGPFVSQHFDSFQGSSQLFVYYNQSQGAGVFGA